MLIILFELNSTDTNLSRKIMGYQIYGNHTKFVSEYLSFLLFLSAFFLALVTKVKIAKTVTSFLALFFLRHLLA